MQPNWMQQLAEAEERAVPDETPPEPANSPLRSLSEAASHELAVQGQPPAQPVPQSAQRVHRTEKWLQRTPAEQEELRYKLENEQAIQRWELQMQQEQDTPQMVPPPPLRPKLNPTTVYTDPQVRAAPNVHQTLRVLTVSEVCKKYLSRSHHHLTTGCPIPKIASDSLRLRPANDWSSTTCTTTENFVAY